MIYILQIILWWLLAALLVVGTGFVTYKILCWKAKKDVEQQLAVERAKLTEQNSEFEKREAQFKHSTDDIFANIALRNNEIKIKEEKATEILINTQQIKRETQIKLDQLTRENISLRNDLTAARQRAKRLANKAKTGV